MCGLTWYGPDLVDLLVSARAVHDNVPVVDRVTRRQGDRGVLVHPLVTCTHGEVEQQSEPDWVYPYSLFTEMYGNARVVTI